MLQKTIQTLSVQGFPQVLRTWGRGRGSAPPLPPVGEALQNLMGGGGLSQYMGEHGRDLKCCQEILVKEFI